MNTRLQRISAGLLALLLPVCLISCGNLADTADADSFGDLSSYYGAEDQSPQEESLTAFALPYASGASLDPLTCPDGAQLTLCSLLYEPLYELDAQFVPQAVLADSASYDAVSLVYTITLRDDVTFSDGSALTGRDVADTLERAMVSTRYAARLRDIAQVESDGRTVRLTLNRNNANILALLDIPIVKSGTETNTVPVGSGPYVWSVDDDGACLLPNDSWWQDKALPFTRIGLYACKSNESMFYAFSARDVHLLFCDLTGTDTGALSITGDYTDADTTVMQYLGFNMTGLFADTSLRCAVSQVINRQSIVDACLLGHGVSAAFPINPASAQYPDVSGMTSSVSAYTDALEAAGLNTGTQSHTVTLLVNEENAFRLSAAGEIASLLTQGDLIVHVEALPWNEYQAALQSGSFDLYYGESRLRADWDVSALISAGGSLNYGYYNNAGLDSSLSACLSAEASQRPALFTAFCRRWQEETPVAVICFKKQSLLYPSGAISGVAPTISDPFSALENWDIRWSGSAN